MITNSVAVPLARNQECRLPLSDTALFGAQVSRDRISRLTSQGKRGVVLAALLLASAGAWAQNGVFAAPQPVGVASGAQSVTVAASAAGTVATVDVLTMGAQGLDFTVGGGVSTCTTATLTTAPPSNCTESVTFTPTAPGVRMGAVVLLDVSNNVLGTAYLSGTGTGGLGVLVPGRISTFAGVFETSTPLRENIQAVTANLNQPTGVVMDGAGNIYIADSANNLVRKVAPPVAPATSGIITIYAGTGVAGYVDGVAATSAELNDPVSVAVDGAGNLYIADAENNVIREVIAATGFITTAVGNGTAGFAGDGVATSGSTELNGPLGITVDATGNLYIADTINQRIRRVDAVTRVITTVAGTGIAGYRPTDDSGLATAAELNFPYAVAFDSAHNMYIPDSANDCVRRVVDLTKDIFTFAGTCTQAGSTTSTALIPVLATAGLLNAPSGVAVDAADNLYISDTQNHRIEKVNATSDFIYPLVSSGTQTTVNLSVIPPALGTDQIDSPIGIFVDPSANVFFADSLYMEIEEVKSDQSVLDFTATPVLAGTQSAPQTQMIENDGNSPVDLTAFTAVADATDPLNINAAAIQPPTPPTTCITTGPLAKDANCVVGIVFAPAAALPFAPGAASELAVGDVDVAGTATNGVGDFPLDIIVVGEATSLSETTITLTSSLNPSIYGIAPAVTFTATVTSGAGVPTGTVTFTDITPAGPTITLCANVAVNAATGVALCPLATNSMLVGINKINASYTPTAGSTFLASSTVAPLLQEVDEETETVLALTGGTNPSALGTLVTFTATVTALGGGPIQPDGTVTFYDGPAGGGAIIGTPQTMVNGTASISTATLTFGQHTITAVYSGDAAKYILGSSGTLLQDVQATTSTTLVPSPNPSTYGAAVLFTATVLSGGVPATNGTVNFFDGNPLLPANQIGTAALTASGTASFTIATLTVGTHPITAVFVANLDYSASTSPTIQQVVNKGASSTALSALPIPGIAGLPEALTATVNAAIPLAPGVLAPTGTVTFVDTFNGVPTTLGTIGLNGGAATINANPPFAPGQHTIVATYNGDLNYNSSSSTFLLTVNQATTTVTLTSSLNPSPVLAPVTFTAVVTGNGAIPTGTVTFSDAFGGTTTTLGSALLDPTGTARFTVPFSAPGTHTISARYGGDVNDAASTSNTFAQLVGLIPTITDLEFSATTGANPQTVLVAVILNSPSTGNAASLPTPTGTVVFSIVNGTTTTPLGTATLDPNGVATLTPNVPLAGFDVVAAYSGDALHSPSTSSIILVPNISSNFTLTVLPNPVSIPTGQNTNVTVTLTSTNGFTDTIGLGCGSLPAGVNCHFSQNDTLLQPNGVLKVQLTIDTNNPLGGGATAKNANPGGMGVSLAGIFLPVGAIFGLLVWRFRRRYKIVLTTVMIFILGGAAMLVSGCSGLSQSSVTPGTYVIQVIGVGATSGITQYQNVTLTITAK
jgi:hypothetical protein